MGRDRELRRRHPCGLDQELIAKTDGYAGYTNPEGRTHLPINLSGRNSPAAHIAPSWIHRLFSNFKRWAMGTSHGLREKHVDAYCDEFVPSSRGKDMTTVR